MAKVLTPKIMAIDEMVVAALKRKICPTKHAPDVVDSAASVSIFPASEASASEADSTPATTQVM